MKTRKIFSRFFTFTTVAQVAFYSYILAKKVKRKGAARTKKELKNKLKKKIKM